MYAIIFWPNDQTVRPMLNADGSLFLNEVLGEADKDAEEFQKEHPGMETRVISIEGVSE